LGKEKKPLPGSPQVEGDGKQE